MIDNEDFDWSELTFRTARGMEEVEDIISFVKNWLA
jgi:hypothetical protein